VTHATIAALAALIAQITVDAYDDGEQLAAFLVAADDAMPVPQIASIVSVDVHVVGIDQGPDERRGLEGVCQRDGTEYRVGLADVAFHPDSEIATVVAAHRHWLGLNPWLPTSTRAHRSDQRWRYPRHGDAVPPLGGRPPLELRDPTVWDPRAEYWDDPDVRLPDWWTPIMAAGPRISYELEQVLPGLDDDAWFDPILDAVDDAHAGDAHGARRKLHALLEADPRYVDAYAHLGWLQREPDQALGHYQAGVAIAELSLPDEFDGVLPWGRLDNRPFLRCLHGLCISLWRLARFDEATAAAESLLWLNPADHQGASEIVADLRARRRWRKPREHRPPPPPASNASTSQAATASAAQEPNKRARHTTQALPGPVLRQRWLQTLLRADVTTVGQLRALSDEQLSEIPNIGPKAIADIAAALATLGLTPDDPLHAIASPTTSDRDRRILEQSR
jgi:tetratricopeptide (TPR) repeat protein